MQWLGPVQKGHHQIFFSLIAPNSTRPVPRLICSRLAKNAVALTLPSPALAVIGKFQGIEAELAVVAVDHFYSKGLNKISSHLTNASSTSSPTEILIATTSPIDMDWDLKTGTLHIVVETDTTVRLALAADTTLRLNGNPVVVNQSENGLTEFSLLPGRLVLEGAKPAPARLQQLTRRLNRVVKQGLEERYHASGIATHSPNQLQGTQLSTAMTADVGGPIVDLITVPSSTRGRIYVAEGETIHVLSPDGTKRQKLEADSPIRMLRWWQEHNLLLVGGADEQVLAFDESGRRNWVFTSKMDPAVRRTGKTYWFKSARDHAGIHGLYTGIFLDGKSQAFVGSATTLEILDENGQLIKRMPQFWGTVSHFAIVDGPNDTLNLLASRKRNGTNRVAIINNKTLSPHPRGFHTVPTGHTDVPGWKSMNRHHLFYEDLDDDGIKEVISETNGTWNRVTVWRVDGKALCAASFGPGGRIPAKTMRDLEITDLDGDGKKEIIAATSTGQVIALDHQCQKVWTSQLSSPPTVMQTVAPQATKIPWLVIGSENGSVVVLNGKGQFIRWHQVNGGLTAIKVLSMPSASPIVLLGTREGEIKGFKVD